MANDKLEAEIVPGLGGAITSLRIKALDVDLLWHTPWGLRTAGSVAIGSSPEARAMEWYPGGWQTAFPNGGDSTFVHGIEWPMHGEAWTAPFEWESCENTVRMGTRFVLSPFHFVREVSLLDNEVHVRERATNVGAETVHAMWGQHPALGPPFVGDSLRIAAGGRTTSLQSTPQAVGALGESRDWPMGRTIHGLSCNLDTLPLAGEAESRMNYIEGPPDVRLANDSVGMTVDLCWDHDTFPYLWYWLESGGRTGFPWYGAARVLALEPFSSWPGWGVDKVRDFNATTLEFSPGESKSAWLTLRTQIHTRKGSEL